MSFKAVTVLKLLIDEYQINVKTLADINEKFQSDDWPIDYRKMLLETQSYCAGQRQKIAGMLQQAGIDVNRPLEEQILTIDRARVLCNRRGWPSDWQSRMAYLVEEASEYFSALRGKGSQDVIGEGGDLLNCVYAALSISGIDPVEFETRMCAKISELWDAPRRPGEHYQNVTRPLNTSPDWVRDRRPLSSEPVWLLLKHGSVYPAFHKVEKLAGDNYEVGWLWEDGEPLRTSDIVEAWMPREIDKPKETT